MQDIDQRRNHEFITGLAHEYATLPRQYLCVLFFLVVFQCGVRGGHALSRPLSHAALWALGAWFLLCLVQDLLLAQGARNRNLAAGTAASHHAFCAIIIGPQHVSMVIWMLTPDTAATANVMAAIAALPGTVCAFRRCASRGIAALSGTFRALRK